MEQLTQVVEVVLVGAPGGEGSSPSNFRWWNRWLWYSNNKVQISIMTSKIKVDNINKVSDDTDID